jgi:hypothetical protein
MTAWMLRVAPLRSKGLLLRPENPLDEQRCGQTDSAWIRTQSRGGGASAGRRPKAEISGASVTWSLPAWMAARCASISASSARPVAHSWPRTCRMVAAFYRSQASSPIGEEPASPAGTLA